MTPIRRLIFILFVFNVGTIQYNLVVFRQGRNSKIYWYVSFYEGNDYITTNIIKTRDN